MGNEIMIEGERIYLRPLKESDADGNYPEWFNDPEVCKYNNHGSVKGTKEGMLKYIESVKNSDSVIVFAILDKVNDRHIGNISLQDINKTHNKAEMAIIIGERDYWGKSIGKEAWKLVIDYGFNVLGLHRIYCGTHIENVGMQRIATSCGMEKEGVLKDDMFKNEVYADVIRYGVINPNHLKK